MELRKVVTYKIPFRSKSILWCGIFLALSVFLRCLHYFIPCDFTQINSGEWIFKIILPILLCAAYGVLIRIVKLRAPGIYGILAAVLTLTMLIGDFFDCNLLQIILSAITLIILSFLLLATYGGYIPYRSICACATLIVCLLRVLFWTSVAQTGWLLLWMPASYLDYLVLQHQSNQWKTDTATAHLGNQGALFIVIQSYLQYQR